MLANPMAVAVIAKECVEKFGDLKKWESVVGTGPWTLDTYRPNVGYNASRMAAFIAGKYDLGWENPGTINRVDWVQIKDTLKQKRPRLQTAEFPSIESARAMGGGHLRIVLRRVVPNVMATVIIVAVIVLGGVILAESSISFLGLGVPPPQPSWGAMLADFGPLLHAARPGWPPSPAWRSRSRSSASTCSATRSATSSIPASEAPAPVIKESPLQEHRHGDRAGPGGGGGGCASGGVGPSQVRAARRAAIHAG